MFKGEWIAQNRGKGEGEARAYVWISPEERALYGKKSSRMLRAHYVWLKAHPGETIKRGEVIHHKNHDSLDDRPGNLQKLPNQRTHARLHARLSGVNAERHASRQPVPPCEVCGEPTKRLHRRFCSVACTAKAQSGTGNPNHGREHTEAVREAQRQRASGKKASPETREKMRQAHLKRWAERKAQTA